MRIRLRPLLTIPLALAACSSALPPRPTLCQLAEHRADYAGQRLTVEGHLLVSRHGSTVSDPRCGFGVGITWSVDANPGLRALHTIADQSQTQPMMIRVRVTGEMRQDRHHEMEGERPWFLDLTDAQVLSAQPLAPADAARYLTWLEGPSPAPFQPSR